MAASKVAFPLIAPESVPFGLSPAPPQILFGLGTPAGTLSPWKDLPKGSKWISTDQTNVAEWIKVQSNNAVADWALVDGIKHYESPKINIDNGAGTAYDDVSYWPRAITVLTAFLVFAEATDASGVAEANVKIGTTAAGTEVVAAVAIAANKAVGSAQTLSIVSGVVAAGGFLNIRHTGIASTEAGEYKVHLTYIEQ